MTKYASLFTIDLLHEYYKDNIAQGLQLKPDAATAAWIKQNGGLMKQQANKCYLLLPDTVDISDAGETNSLVFTGSSFDTQFVTFSDYPKEELGYQLFATAGDSTTLNATFVSEKGAVNKLFEVKIELAVLVGETGKAFSLQFNTRSVPWCYYIIDRNKEPYKQIVLTGEKSDLFSNPVAKEIPGVGHGWQIDSGENKLPLKEIGRIKLGLKAETNTGATQSIVLYLPNPSPSSIALNEQNTLIAAMYVYI